MGTKVYFFKDGTYVRYDRSTDAVDDDYPLLVADKWPGLTEYRFGSVVLDFARPDAALNLERGKVYFFKGDSYVRYDLAAATEGVEHGWPKKIGVDHVTRKENWPGMKAAGFDRDLDAAVNWGNGKAYFFKGDSYVRYDLAAATEGVEHGWPKKIGVDPVTGKENWPGMKAAGFDRDLDAAVNWGNGKVYFFKGDKYVRYDMIADRVDPADPPWPKKIGVDPVTHRENWPGMEAAGFDSRVRASTDIFDGREIWLPTAERMPATKPGPSYVPRPWRGVLHTTQGDEIDGALKTFRDTGFWPTLTIEPNFRRIVQHYPLNTGARALDDGGGVPDTNRARCVQIEIVGRAEKTPGWSDEQLSFIAEVIRQIEDHVPIPHRSGRTFLDHAGADATPGNRMTADQWRRYSGWCGHQHVPGQRAGHWDPGAIDIDTILQL